MGKHSREKRHGCLGCFGRLVTFLLLIMIIGYPFAEPFFLDIDNVVLTEADLPEDVGQLRIVYLSDIHMSGIYTRARVAQLINRVNALNADLILLGGDYVDDAGALVSFFADLPVRFNARYGIYAVFGEKDNITGAVPDELRAAMNRAGIAPLQNSGESISIGRSRIYIVGAANKADAATLSYISGHVRQEDYVIFLSHSPAVLPEAVRASDANGSARWFDLGLFGHTHGGQIKVLDSLLGLTADAGRYKGGWYQENRMDILVSNGVGTSVFPIRIGCKPQVHLITVKRY